MQDALLGEDENANHTPFIGRRLPICPQFIHECDIAYPLPNRAVAHMRVPKFCLVRRDVTKPFSQNWRLVFQKTKPDAPTPAVV